MLNSILHRRKWIKKDSNSNKIDQSLGRELGDYEMLMAMSHDRGNKIVAGTVKISTKRVLCNDKILVKLKLLQKQHPMLRMTIQKLEQLSKTRYHFVEMPNPYVNFPVSETNDYDSVVAQQMLESFDVASGPLWRVRLIKQPHPTVPTDIEYKHPYVFIFAVHHSISDGASFGFVIASFFYYLTEIHAGKSVDITPMDMPSPMDFYLEPALKALENKLPDDAAKYFQVIAGEQNAFVAKYSAEILRSPSVPIETRKLETIMSQKETQSMIDACMKNGATVTGALIAASCIVMADLLNDGESSQDRTIPVEIQVNMRPFVT